MSIIDAWAVESIKVVSAAPEASAGAHTHTNEASMDPRLNTRENTSGRAFIENGIKRLRTACRVALASERQANPEVVLEDAHGAGVRRRNSNVSLPLSRPKRALIDRVYQRS